MKHIARIDIQKKDEIYVFTLEFNRKITTFNTEAIFFGFEKIKDIIEKKEFKG